MHITITYFMQKKRGEKVTLELLEKMKDKDDDNIDWQSALKSLTKKGLLLAEDGSYTLSEKAKPIAAKLMKERMEKGFSEGLVRDEQSETYGKFCNRLYGKNLSQFNMTPMNQLNNLIEKLNLDENCHVLDLGCGIGRISEYISDTTKAKVTGIDFAAPSIQRANERNIDKKERLNFIVGNMNNLQFIESSFDIIIAIDTVYFVDDLEKLIKRLKEITKDGGRMGIFYDEMIKPEDNKQILKADNTKLAKVLKKHDLEYLTYNYTDEEKDVWKRALQLSEEMRDEFDAAGEISTYESRIEESKHVLSYVNEDRISRYLYIVRVEK